jgi:valyl-tRNA synthetase
VRNEMGLPDRERLSVIIDRAGSDETRLGEALPFLQDRANADIRLDNLTTITTKGITTVVGMAKVRIEFTGAQEELLGTYKAKLAKQLAGKHKAAKGKQARLANPGYVNNAPAEKVQETRDLLARDEAEIAKLEETIAAL